MPKIHIQRERPETCELCHLCVKRPEEELPYNTKFTHYCLALKKELSGRGIKASDKHHRFSCSPGFYKKIWDSCDGDFPVSETELIKYNELQMWLPFDQLRNK